MPPSFDLFGLTFRDNHGMWTSRIFLPCWADFLPCMGSYASIDSSEKAGMAWINISKGYDDPIEAPEKFQIEAVAGIVEYSEHLMRDVCKCAMEYHNKKRLDFPEIKQYSVRTEEIIGIHAVHINKGAKLGAAYIGYEFGYIFDEEHGFGVSTCGGKLIAFGDGGTATAEYWEE